MAVRVQCGDFDVAAELARLRSGHPRTGAVVAFVGTVRELDGCGDICALELEHYPGMTEVALEDIAAQARQRWPIIDVAIVHRIGRLRGSDQIVLAAVAAQHRGDAFAACEFVMDFLKADAPFWKKETTPGGARWVEARASDQAALAKWESLDPGPRG